MAASRLRRLWRRGPDHSLDGTLMQLIRTLYVCMHGSVGNDGEEGSCVWEVGAPMGFVVQSRAQLSWWLGAGVRSTGTMEQGVRAIWCTDGRTSWEGGRREALECCSLVEIWRYGAEFIAVMRWGHRRASGLPCRLHSSPAPCSLMTLQPH